MAEQKPLVLDTNNQPQQIQTGNQVPFTVLPDEDQLSIVTSFRFLTGN